MRDVVIFSLAREVSSELEMPIRLPHPTIGLGRLLSVSNLLIVVLYVQNT